MAGAPPQTRSAELVARLEVSPASVSEAVGWLEQRGLIIREREGGRQRYVVDDDFGYRAWRISLDAMTRWAEVTRRGAGLMPVLPASAQGHERGGGTLAANAAVITTRQGGRPKPPALSGPPRGHPRLNSSQVTFFTLGPSSLAWLARPLRPLK